MSGTWIESWCELNLKWRKGWREEGGSGAGARINFPSRYTASVILVTASCKSVSCDLSWEEKTDPFFYHCISDATQSFIFTAQQHDRDGQGQSWGGQVHFLFCTWWKYGNTTINTGSVYFRNWLEWLSAAIQFTPQQSSIHLSSATYSIHNTSLKGRH